jgi:hypothetical protein
MDLRTQYDAATIAFERASEEYERACQQFPDLYTAVLDAENNVSMADVNLEYATFNQVDVVEHENKLNYAKSIYQDALFKMNEMVHDAYLHKITTQVHYVTARRNYHQSR